MESDIVVRGGCWAREASRHIIMISSCVSSDRRRLSSGLASALSKSICKRFVSLSHRRVTALPSVWGSSADASCCQYNTLTSSTARASGTFSDRYLLKTVSVSSGSLQVFCAFKSRSQAPLDGSVVLLEELFERMRKLVSSGGNVQMAVDCFPAQVLQS